jgi:hypothetical protein
VKRLRGRSTLRETKRLLSPLMNEADVAQLVEHSLGKGEVISSILIIGSISFIGGEGSARFSRSGGGRSGLAGGRSGL